MIPFFDCFAQSLDSWNELGVEVTIWGPCFLEKLMCHCCDGLLGLPLPSVSCMLLPPFPICPALPQIAAVAGVLLVLRVPGLVELAVLSMLT